MDPFKGLMKRHDPITGLHTKNSIVFLRPEDGFGVASFPGPSSDVAQPLRFRQIRFAAAQLILGTLSLRDVGTGLSDLGACDYELQFLCKIELHGIDRECEESWCGILVERKVLVTTLFGRAHVRSDF